MTAGGYTLGITNQMSTDTRSKQWVFTWNNYTDLEYESLAAVDCVYMVVGKEVAPETGTQHLQGYIVLKSLKSLKQMKKLMTDAVHWDIAHGNASQNFGYCSKDGDFVEYGERPANPGRKKGEQADKWKKVLEAARAGEEQEDPQVEFLHGKTCKWHREQALLKRQCSDTEDKHLWYWGETGTGKSRKAREENPDAYLKMCNKWWDGYEDHEVVLIEDFDQAHSVLGHHMKIWSDRYPFLAEIKGGSRKIRPRLVIVTSNWHPRDIWSDSRTLGPIERRFECVEFKRLEQFDNT